MPDDRVETVPAEPQPPRGDDDPVLVVGLGGSAGAIQGLRTFFASVPPDTGAAYVVVVHLSPDHESTLAHILQGMTTLPVEAAHETVRLRRDHVYVISPRTSLRLEDGALVVSSPRAGEERRAPIDVFFRTLALSHGARAVGIVLSGTGADGTSGLKHLKEYGGLTLAQDPGEAEHKDMPSNAIATGLVDFTLGIEEMGARIATYLRAGVRHAAPEEEGGAVDALREILNVLRVRTGHDFSQYKTATVLRRIERRRHIHAARDLAAYAAVLRSHPQEADALLRDLLISVTHFFRDPEAYAALEATVLPRLAGRRRGPEGMIRAWVAGCATGEEAYSIAMLLMEAAERSADAAGTHVFATDVDARAIAKAREGFYTDAEVADVPPHRLRRFFQREVGGYRVRRELRGTVLFATHNLLRDPPFSHLDLICCRNVLIYLNRQAQDSVLETFHFALRPGGYLFLGAAESSDGNRDLFTTVDRSARIFEMGTPTGPPARVILDHTSAVPPPTASPGLWTATPTVAERISAADLHLQLVEQYAPPSVVVSEDGHVLHVSARAAAYLHLGGGEPSRDLLKLVRSEIRSELRSALHQAGRERTPVLVPAIQVAIDGIARAVELEVRPVLREGEPARGFFLVLFREGPSLPSDAVAPARAANTADPVLQVEEELARVKAQLRATIEQYETQVEEVKASNEELQAVNEELRSSAEELETSQEELQSVNEELTTVNQELKLKIDELAIANSDFRNLINSTDIATIFLDRKLRVKLTTPGVREVFNLVPHDTGRSLSDITSSLLYPTLAEDLEGVLHSLRTIEREVPSVTGAWYLARVLPYRTADDHIAGVVLTFQDISSRKQAEMQVRASEERLRLLIDSVKDYAIFTVTLEGRVATWNLGANRVFGYTAEEILGQPVAILFTPEDRAAAVPERELSVALEHGRAEDDRWHVRKDGSRFFCSGVTTLLGDGPIRGFAKIARDLTGVRQAQSEMEALGASMEERVRQRTRELESEVADRITAEQRATELVRKLVSAQEDERARVARDIHDSVGQQLTALRLSLERLLDTSEGEAAEEVERALTTTRDIGRDLDFLAWELRPAALDDFGLVAALSRYLRAWGEHVDIPTEFRTAGLDNKRLDPETETTLYRIVQEALNNVVKHAHASRVDVILDSRGDAIVLVVEDNGVGFEAAEGGDAAQGLGLVGMRERAALVGAVVQIESSPGSGTTVFFRQHVRAQRADS